MKKLFYTVVIIPLIFIGFSCTKENNPKNNQTEENNKSNIELPISGTYVWNFIIPQLDSVKQKSTMIFETGLIKYDMKGDAYTNSYDMIVESYNKKENKIIAIGKGGKSISKEGVYFDIFLKNIEKDKVTIFKKEFKTKKEAEQFQYPADDTEDSHGWNVYTKKAS